ncbi:MAG: hypothetical protein DIU56_002295 [Pseudomonadota bacterium]|jgi:hypothetical protein
MAENTNLGASNGEQKTTQTSHAHVQQAKEHLKDVGQAATEAVRSRADQAQAWVRDRSGHARQWARSQWGGIQRRVETDPARATMWALGIGFVAGMLLTGMLRSGHRRD